MLQEENLSVTKHVKKTIFQGQEHNAFSEQKFVANPSVSFASGIFPSNSIGACIKLKTLNLVYLE